MSQHANCTLRVTVLPGTSSPGKEHKFKVSGVMAASGELHGTDWFRTGAHFHSGHRFEDIQSGSDTMGTPAA